MRKILLIFVAVAIAACSSGPKEDSAGGPAPMVFERESAPEAPAAEAEPPPSRTSSEDAIAELTDAIKAQNEDRIRRAAERVLARNPTDDRALNALAMLHYRKGQFDYAAYLLGKAIEAHPRRAELHSNFGLVEFARGERAAAVRGFRKALELNADDGVAGANLGAIYVAEKDYAKAVIVLETAVRRGPRDAKTLSNYGIALAAIGQGDKAKAAYEDALKATPGSREVMLNYAILLVDHLDRPKDGIEVINRLKFLGPAPESRERLSLLENKAKAGVK